jgi:hypothetical protein
VIPRENGTLEPTPARHRIFLLSPANTGGERAAMILSDRARFELADRVRRSGAPLGDIYSFISGLYFRGKLAYAQTFSNPPAGVTGCLIITPGRGLMPPEVPITLEQLREIASVPVDASEPRYRAPLEGHASILAEAAGEECDFVLLGSVATPKYLEPLLRVFGERLLFPIEFVGRGDMSRGGLLLRCSRAGLELNYVPVHSASKHGPRPPKLPKLRRT